MVTKPLTHQPLLQPEQIDELVAAGSSVELAPVASRASLGKQGESLSRVRGSGMEYDDLAPFTPTDDPRNIDWRASARSQQTLVRRYLAQLTPPVVFVIDRSASMRFGSRRRLKVTQAVRASLWLSGAYLQQGYEQGALLLDQPNVWLAPAAGYEGIQRIARQACAAAPPIAAQAIDWHRALMLLMVELPRGTELILISDFVDLNPSHANLLVELGERCNLNAVRIVDPVERQTTDLANLQLEWGARSVAMDTPSARLALRQDLDERSTQLQRVLARAKASMLELDTVTERFDQSLLRGGL